MKKNKAMMLGFLLPAVLAYLVVYLYPTIRTIWMSFCHMDDLGTPIYQWTFAGINNYKELFHNGLFLATLKNIVKIWIIGILIVFPVSMLLGVIVTSNIKGKLFFKAVIYLPAVISPIAVGTMWVHYVYNPKFGFLNSIFKLFGLDNLVSTVWLAPDKIFMAMLIAFCSVISGYFMLIFSSAMEGIPKVYYEAATIETQSNFIKFRTITLPLLRPTIKTCLILWTLQVAGFFIWPQMFSQFTLTYETAAPVNLMYALAFGSKMSLTRNVGAASCIGVLLFGIIIAAYAIVNLTIKDKDVEY